ncbi:MAG: rhodanese-like domain-containing protein [Holosporales bacterium]|nr:rhodanese-like domain-containing protein [Holosporales bacterium]
MLLFTIPTLSWSQSQQIATITAKELHELIDQQEIELIDVRNTDEFVFAFIDGAKSLPLPLVTGQQVKPRGKKVVVYCKSGKRGAKATQALKEQNPEIEVLNLQGGITEWIKADLPTKTISKQVPIMRQVQIIVGCLILLGLLLSHFVSSYFLLLPLCMGSGLLMAGFTGWCGMAELLNWVHAALP